MVYTITGVTYVKDIDYKGKVLKKYRVKAEESNEVFEFVQSAELGDPQEGDKIDGEILHNNYGAYFKKSFSGKPFNQTRLPFKSQSSDYSMYASYAKDLLIAYANFMDWDKSKIDMQTFYKLVRMAGNAALLLRDSENDKSLTETEIKSSWNDPFDS